MSVQDILGDCILRDWDIVILGECSHHTSLKRAPTTYSPELEAPPSSVRAGMPAPGLVDWSMARLPAASATQVGAHSNGSSPAR